MQPQDATPGSYRVQGAAQYFQKWCLCSKAEPWVEKADHSERLTARYDVASNEPIASVRTESASSASSADESESGNRTIPRSSRSASEMVAGSTNASCASLSS